LREYNAFVQFVKQREGESFVLATLKSTEGSTYRKAGAQKIIALNGESVGLMSGGCLEREIVDVALSVQRKPKTEVFDTTSEQDRLFGYAIGCQGKLTIEFETMNWPQICGHLEDMANDKMLWVHVVGAGPDLDSLNTIFNCMGWSHCYHSTQSDLVQQRLEQGWEISHLQANAKVSVAAPERSAVLLMSHNYPTDLEMLAGLVDRLPAYVGILGPEKRRDKMLEDLQSIYGKTLAASQLQQIHGPIGIPGVGRGETAIALSIATELQMHFFGDQV
jgi:xanthine dehydrogenase accessory factor